MLRNFSPGSVVNTDYLAVNAVKCRKLTLRRLVPAAVSSTIRSGNGVRSMDTYVCNDSYWLVNGVRWGIG